ncbi:MAG: S1 family peptidase [Lachnospiraceae bacterium]|nr:S1 family peptidase [Lachnospiraceae bacterium]
MELNTSSENLPEGFEDNQQLSIGVVTDFFDYLNNTYGTVVDDSVYTVNGVSAGSFPSYYAGAYINTEGRLIIQVVEEYYTPNYRNSSWYQDFVRIVGSEEFFCHPVKYSYSELIEAISEVSMGNLSQQLSSLGIVIGSAAINDYKNVIEIRVRSQNDSMIVASCIDSDIYEITIVEDTPQAYIGLYPGEGVTTDPHGNNDFSVACRVRRNNPGGTYTYGFLTCAHTFAGTENVYMNLGTGMSNNTLLGFSNVFYQKLGGNADVAFIETNSSTTLYNTVYLSTTILDATMATAVQGQTIYKRGNSTGLTYATVLDASTSSPIIINGVSYIDIVETTAFAAPGDSGGIVFTEPVSGHAKCLGIIVGGSVTISYYSKIQNDIAALQSGPISFTIY